MRPRLLILRRLPARPSNTYRAFAQSTSTRSGLRTRPQLPFLSVPSASRPVRFLTTERRARLKFEIKQGIKYTAYIWVAVGCVAAASVAVHFELLEREYPTPHEWSIFTRICFRGGHCARDQTDPNRPTDWPAIFTWIERVVERLEDPTIDGKDLRDAPSDRPPGTKDLSAKSEEWRRGYFETLMLYAKAAEHLDGWVRDTTRNMVFPPGIAVGTSNPWPRPLPPGFHGARPKEEDCEPAYESADNIYLKLISTEGLTTRQRMEASLAYASWLEFRGDTGPAGIMYEDSLNIALAEQTSLPTEPVDRKTWTLNDAAGLPSANVLTALTAFATFKARTGDMSLAFPVLVSLLRARKSLPAPDSPLAPARPLPAKPAPSGVENKIVRFFTPPAYPPPPPDGKAPPVRDAKEICEEAALSLYIGEIMYSSQDSSREEGLGWTREAVDIAEEQLHRLGTSKADRPARLTCRECLITGLGNWSDMVARLAKEEAAKKEAAASQPKKASWFGLWGDGKEEDLSRWAAEERVIEERKRRVKDLADELEPPGSGLASLFTA